MLFSKISSFCLSSDVFDTCVWFSLTSTIKPVFVFVPQSLRRVSRGEALPQETAAALTGSVRFPGVGRDDRGDAVPWPATCEKTPAPFRKGQTRWYVPSAVSHVFNHETKSTVNSWLFFSKQLQLIIDALFFHIFLYIFWHSTNIIHPQTAIYEAQRIIVLAGNRKHDGTAHWP